MVKSILLTIDGSAYSEGVLQYGIELAKKFKAYLRVLTVVDIRFFESTIAIGVEGFAPILDLLPVEAPTHTLIVVRPALLDPLLPHLKDMDCTVFSVTAGNRDELPLRIVEALWGDQHHCSVR